MGHRLTVSYSFPAEDFFADVRDLAGARGPCSFATGCSRAARAARADDARRLAQGILDPRDVEYVCYGAEPRCRSLWNASLPTPRQAIFKQRADEIGAVCTVRVECRCEIHTNRQD